MADDLHGSVGRDLHEELRVFLQDRLCAGRAGVARRAEAEPDRRETRPDEERATEKDQPRRHSPAAFLTAARMRTYVPQRQRFPASDASISSSVGFGFFASRAAAVMICPP